MGAVIYPTLEHVAMEARPYPAHLLEGCETGLVLFAAAFLGHNDAIHFAEAGVQTTCVDTDAERLAEMRTLYPEDWEWEVCDAWDYEVFATGYCFQWDAVSCDTWTGDLMHRSLASLNLWCSLAHKLVTATITDDVPMVDAPDGWKAELFPRSERVSWLVLTRD